MCYLKRYGEDRLKNITLYSDRMSTKIILANIP